VSSSRSKTDCSARCRRPRTAGRLSNSRGVCLCVCPSVCNSVRLYVCLMHVLLRVLHTHTHTHTHIKMGVAVSKYI
jgi:hypothetical protein